MKMKRFHRGVGLIEVLVAVLVASIGLLGIASTLLTTMRTTTSSYLRQEAVQDAYNIVDRMRSNITAATVAGGAYTTTLADTAASTAPTDCSSASCSPSNMAAYDVWQWKTLLSKNLPNGKGAITVAEGTNATTTITVEVQWDDSAAQAALTCHNASCNAGTSSNTATYTVVTAL